jgi:hypothetical protein
MFKEFHDENAEKMRGLAKTIRPTTDTSYHEAEAKLPSHPVSKAGPLIKQFFDQPEVSVRNVSTEQLVASLAGAGVLNTAFRDGMKALYPTIPEMWDVPPPKAGNMASRPLDYMDAGRGGYPEPAKGLAVVLQRNAAAKALSKAVKDGTGGDGLEEWRKKIAALMPPDVLKHYLANA